MFMERRPSRRRLRRSVAVVAACSVALIASSCSSEEQVDARGEGGQPTASTTEGPVLGSFQDEGLASASALCDRFDPSGGGDLLGAESVTMQMVNQARAYLNAPALPPLDGTSLTTPIARCTYGIDALGPLTTICPDGETYFAGGQTSPAFLVAPNGAVAEEPPLETVAHRGPC
jgi:hypothetical protein